MDTSTEKKSWYSIENIDTIDSPALVVYADRVKANIQLLKTMIDDPQRLRPHVKTHKSKEVCLLLMKAGINKFKCATIAEAEMLGQVHAPDVLLAYQPAGPKMERLIALVQKYPATTFSCLVDNEASATQLSEKAVAAHLQILVYIDLNVGMNRTGIAPGKEAVDLYACCQQLKGVMPIGLHVYDGHIHASDLAIRKKEADAAFAMVEAVTNALLQKGIKEPVIIVGGTPTFPIHAKRKNVECSPGTFIYWDANYETAFAEQHFLPAALVISRIISIPDATTLCVDLGHKSIASENELAKRVQFLNAPELKCISHSEEHLTLKAPEGHSYKVGDVLYGLPYHICPTCALYDTALVVEGKQVTGSWKVIARDRKLNT